jgi:hypothetical protein
LVLFGQNSEGSLPEIGSFEQAVTFALGDADGDALSFLDAIDSTSDWYLYRLAVLAVRWS